MLHKLIASVSTFVVIVASVGTAYAAPKTTSLEPNTINKQEIDRIVRHAYQKNAEARLCVDFTRAMMLESALGYCYSWYVQAIDDKEKAIAQWATADIAKAIRDGIASERD